MVEALSFQPSSMGNISLCINLHLIDDLAVEADKSLLVTLNATNSAVVLHPAQANVTITDGDGKIG